MDVATILALVDRMESLRQQTEAAESEYKRLKAQYDQVRKFDLPDAMADAGLLNVKRDDGSLIYLTMKTHASVKADDRPALHQWLRENGHEGLISETVWSGTLDAWARAELDEGHTLPPMLTTFDETTAVIRKKKNQP